MYFTRVILSPFLQIRKHRETSDAVFHPCRYILQIMVEASCLEWASVAAVVLRDAMAIIRIVNAARSAQDAPCVVQRLYQGFIQLDNYAQHTCLGYRAFMTSIQPQVRSLAKFINAAGSPPSVGLANVAALSNGPSSTAAAATKSPPVQAAGSPTLYRPLPRSLSDPLGTRLGVMARELPSSSSGTVETETSGLGTREEEDQQQQSSCSIS
jgi:hypothetical protein